MLMCCLTGGGPTLQWPTRSNRLAVLACAVLAGRATIISAYDQADITTLWGKKIVPLLFLQ